MARFFKQFNIDSNSEIQENKNDYIVTTPTRQVSLKYSKDSVCAKFPVLVHDKGSGSVCLKKVPATIKIPFHGFVGDVASVKKLRSGDIFVNCVSRQQQEKLLSITDLGGIHVHCTIPIQKTEGIVFNLNQVHDLSSNNNIIRYADITTKQQNKTITRIVFALETLPETITVGKKVYKVYPYCPPIPRCTRCQRLNHTLKDCHGTIRCSKCGQQHERQHCKATKPHCVNCGGAHSAAFHGCSRKILLRNAYKEKAKQTMSFQDAVDKASKVQQTSTNKKLYSTAVAQPFPPSFTDFVGKIAVPIMVSQDKNIDCLLSIYKDFFQGLSSAQNISQSDQKAAAALLENISPPQTEITPAEDTTENNRKPETTAHHDLDQSKTTKSHIVTRSKDTTLSTQHTLMDTEVDTNVKTLIIGDSVIRGVTLEDGENTKGQVISVSGMTIEDLGIWLERQKTREGVENVLLHIGVNSCKKENLTMKDWLKLIDQAIITFPKARLCMSSIVPPRGQLRKKCDGANASLRAACEKRGIQFCDNSKLFLTKTSAAVRSLYRDCIHPNLKGTKLMSEKIKAMLL